MNPPRKYHGNEDKLAEYLCNERGWKIKKVGSLWKRKDGTKLDYPCLIEQGCCGVASNLDELKTAIAGRIKAAKDHGQLHYDQMESNHRDILSASMAVWLFHTAPKWPRSVPL